MFSNIMGTFAHIKCSFLVPGLYSRLWPGVSGSGLWPRVDGGKGAHGATRSVPIARRKTAIS